MIRKYVDALRARRAAWHTHLEAANALHLWRLGWALMGLSVVLQFVVLVAVLASAR